MQKPERTPHPHKMRDTAQPPPSPPSQTPEENAPDETRITITTHREEVHLYTYPGPTEHYEQSDVNRRIEQNPALFWGNAKF